MQNKIDKIINNKLEEFKEKIKTYDKDGGFIVYIEDYYNQDFDVELIENFIRQSLNQVKEDTIKECIKEIEHKINIYKHIIDTRDVLPKEWHKGNIKFGEDIKIELNNLK